MPNTETTYVDNPLSLPYIFALGDINEPGREELIAGCLMCVQKQLLNAYGNTFAYRDWRYWRGVGALIGTYPFEGATIITLAADLSRHVQKEHPDTESVN